MNAFVSWCCSSLRVHGGEGRFERREIGGRGFGEASARLTGDGDRLGILVGEGGRSGRRVSGRLLQPLALLGGQRFETCRVGEQDIHLRPEIDVRGHVGSEQRPLGVADRATMLVLESLDRPFARASSRSDPKICAGVAPRARIASAWPFDLKVPKVMPAPVRRAEDGSGDADRFAEAVGEDAEPDHVEVVEPVHHLLRDPALDHGVLERVALDQHGRGQRLKALDARSCRRRAFPPSPGRPRPVATSCTTCCSASEANSAH